MNNTSQSLYNKIIENNIRISLGNENKHFLRKCVQHSSRDFNTAHEFLREQSFKSTPSDYVNVRNKVCDVSCQNAILFICKCCDKFSGFPPPLLVFQIIQYHWSLHWHGSILSHIQDQSMAALFLCPPSAAVVCTLINCPLRRIATSLCSIAAGDSLCLFIHQH